jgi:hypothetical protein
MAEVGLTGIVGLSHTVRLGLPWLAPRADGEIPELAYFFQSKGRSTSSKTICRCPATFGWSPSAVLFLGLLILLR